MKKFAYILPILYAIAIAKLFLLAVSCIKPADTSLRIGENGVEPEEKLAYNQILDFFKQED